MSFPSHFQGETLRLEPNLSDDVKDKPPQTHGRLNRLDLRIYTRRNKTDTAIEHDTPDQPTSLILVPEHPEELW